MSLIPSFMTGRRSNIFDPFSLDVWDPFQGTGTRFSTTTSGGAGGGGNEVGALANVPVDWKETQEAHILNADLPVKEGEVEVEDGRVLQISGEKRKEQEETNDKWHRVERSYGRFIRRFRLPENAKMDQIKASLENGVLTVVVQA